MADNDNGDKKPSGKEPEFLEPVAVERFRKLEIYDEEAPPVDFVAGADSSAGVPEEQILEERVRREVIPPPILERVDELRRRQAASSTPSPLPTGPTPAPIPPAPLTFPDDDANTFPDYGANRPTPIGELRPERGRQGNRTTARIAIISCSVLAGLSFGTAMYMYTHPRTTPPITARIPITISDDSLVDILEQFSETEPIKYTGSFPSRSEIEELVKNPEFTYRTRKVFADFFTIHSLPPTEDGVEKFMERYPFLRRTNYFLFFDELDAQAAPFQGKQRGIDKYPVYAGKGKAGAVSIIRPRHLLPSFGQHGDECFPFLDRNAAKTLAERKGKFITSAQFTDLVGSPYFINENPYWPLQALERSGGLESLIAQRQLSNPAQAWELRKQYCAKEDQTTYALCWSDYGIKNRLFRVSEGLAPVENENCHLFSEAVGRALVAYLQKEGGKPWIKKIEDMGAYVYADDKVKQKFDPDGDGCLEKMEKADEPRNKR